MRSTHRLSFIAAALVVSVSLARGQEGPDPSALVGKIANWPAPVYWSPPAQSVSVQEREGGVRTEAVQALPTSPLPFIGITPCRVVDTRGNGFTGAYGPPTLVGNGPARTFDIPAGPCPGIPANAGAYSINVAAILPASNGFMTVFPTGATQPTSSDLNFLGGEVIANAIVAPAGTGGAISIFVNVSTDMILDINGYYSNGPAEGFWSLNGNAGTSGGTNFLGTTDNQALELKVNDTRALRLEPDSNGPNVIGGFSGNSVTPAVHGGTVGGGGAPFNGNSQNRVTDNFGTVSGGLRNVAGDDAGTVDDREAATVGGGLANVASGVESTVPGGVDNTAAGAFSFASGRRAKAMHDGAFVWGDGTFADVASTGDNQFIVRASGGIWLGTTSSPSISIATDFLNTSTGAHLTIGGVWTNNSDRASKENLEAVDGREILSRLASLPLSRWSYKVEGGAVRHIGPMAQDFAAAFGLGSDARSITTLDAEGVSLAAIQALYEIVKEKDGEIEALKARLSKVESAVK